MFQNKPFLCENPLNFPIISGALWFYYQLSPFSNYRCQKLDFQIPELYIYKDIFYIISNTIDYKKSVNPKTFSIREGNSTKSYE